MKASARQPARLDLLAGASVHFLFCVSKLMCVCVLGRMGHATATVGPLAFIVGGYNGKGIPFLRKLSCLSVCLR